ncbi:MAG: alanine/glycine:cation symporter family protein, partial [Bacilli bacterium]
MNYIFVFDELDLIVKEVNTFLWGPFFLIPLLVGTGLYFTIRLRFIQKETFKGFKYVFGNAFKSSEVNEDGMSSFQALATALAAQVGTGNLAGVASALIAGGPGAIFWMWVSAFLGMATNFAEAVLAQLYKTKVNNQISGGPAYYIEKGLNNKWLASFFAFSLIIALGICGNMVQANSIISTTKPFFNQLNIDPLVLNLALGAILALFVALILGGGLKRIAHFTSTIVPIMALFYIVAGLIIIFMNYQNIIPAFKAIISSAFSLRAVSGGALGIGMIKAMRYGIARGLFSNEAGMGSTPHAHALARVKQPSIQGLVALVGVSIDTLIICTLTALIILTTSSLSLSDPNLQGAMLTQKAFEIAFGPIGLALFAIALFFFALSTIIGWYYFAQTNVIYLFGQSKVKYYKLIALAFIIIGSALKID